MSASVPARPMRMLALPDYMSLRTTSDDDLPFLERVYASTRSEELALTDWNEEQKSAFISFQFRAQHQHYISHYHDAEFFIVQRGGVDAGRLYLHWRADELRIVDIALLPDARGAGLGAALLRALIACATMESKAVSIHVEQMNPAMRLYLRLGFCRVGEHGVYHLMRREANEQ